MFARHRFAVGIKNDFKLKFLPIDTSPGDSQNLPLPINRKEDITVELALLHKYSINTTLPFKKYATPTFAQRKPNGKLRLLLHLRKNMKLTSNDYKKTNQTINTLTDAAIHMAKKKVFCKIGCSQAYHCVQMADQQSAEMFAFNFAKETFAY